MKTTSSTKNMVLGAILTALVVILQFMGSFIKLGMFSVSLVLIPIVIGAATCGKKVSAWLGFVFGVIVLISGDAAAFLAVNIPGTIITVLLKGTLCGLFAGIVFDVFKTKNKYVATMASAVVCPLVNTGIFLLGCLIFFMPTVSDWALGQGFGENVGKYMIVVLVGFNFIFELLFNIILSPVIVRILSAKDKN